MPIVMKIVQRETYIMTDEANLNKGQFRSIFLGHGVVNHVAGDLERSKREIQGLSGKRLTYASQVSGGHRRHGRKRRRRNKRW